MCFWFLREVHKMKKFILSASLVIMTSTVLGMSGNNKRGVPSDGFGEQQQVRRVRILEEASTSQTPNIQDVRDNRDVEKLTRYLFDLIGERESANETERDAITERIRETGISEDIENNIGFEIENVGLEAIDINRLRAEGVSQERIRKLKRRAREIAKEKAIERVCNLVRVQANVAPNAVNWSEADIKLESLNDHLIESAEMILGGRRDYALKFINGFPIKYANINVDGHDGIAVCTVANWRGRKANIVRISPNQNILTAIRTSRVVNQDGNWDIVVPQFENRRMIDKNYRVINADGRIEYDTLNFLHQALIQLPRHDQNLDNLLVNLFRKSWKQREQSTDQSAQKLDMHQKKMEYCKKQNDILFPFIIGEMEHGNIHFPSLHFNPYLFGLNSLFLYQDSDSISQLGNQHRLLKSVISDNIRNLTIRDGDINEVPDEIFVLDEIESLSLVMDPNDISGNKNIEGNDISTEQREDGKIMVNYAKPAVDRERKERIRKIEKQIHKIENELSKNEIVSHLNCYKNQINISKNDWEKIVEKNREKKYQKTSYLKNLLEFLRRKDIQNTYSYLYNRLAQLNNPIN